MTDRQKDYQEYLKSAHWEMLRRAVLERDGFRCVRCQWDKHLQVHHKFYRQRFEDSEPDDLETLCRTCHKREHGLIKKPKRARRVGNEDGMAAFIEKCQHRINKGEWLSHSQRRMVRRIVKRQRSAFCDKALNLLVAHQNLIGVSGCSKSGKNRKDLPFNYIH